MQRLLLFLFILISTNGFAQDLSKKIEEIRESAALQSKVLDSMRVGTDSMLREQARISDSINMAAYLEQNNRNLDAMVKNMKERERKQQQGMWFRMGAGILLLGVGIYGVLRKRKPKTGSTGSSVS